MKNLLLRILSSLLFGFIFIYLTNLGGFYLKILLIIIFCLGIFEISKIKNFKIVILIFLILIIFLLSFYSLRSNPNGLFLTLWCLLITWFTDIFAFLFGKLFGKKKLGIISPNKTYFGFISGIIISQLSYPLTNILIKDIFSLDIKKIFLIQLLVSVVVIFGDLFFSFLKRKINIKDFSQLIPGHGGIFDRIDGLIFSIITFNFIFLL